MYDEIALHIEYQTFTILILFSPCHGDLVIIWLAQRWGRDGW